MSRLFFLLLKFSFRSERFRPSYLILYSKRAGKPFWVLSRSFFLLSDVSLERFCYRVAFTVPETCSVFLFFYSCFLWQTCFFQHSLILGKLLGRYGHFCFCIDLAECFASDGSNAGCISANPTYFFSFAPLFSLYSSFSSKILRSSSASVLVSDFLLVNASRKFFRDPWYSFSTRFSVHCPISSSSVIAG